MGAIAIGARARAKRPLLPHFRVLLHVYWHGQQVPRGEVLVASANGAHVRRWLRDGRIERIDLRGTAPIPGICQVCGCTWTRACEGGCRWANRERTICSNCA